MNSYGALDSNEEAVVHSRGFDALSGHYRDWTHLFTILREVYIQFIFPFPGSTHFCPLIREALLFVGFFLG